MAEASTVSVVDAVRPPSVGVSAEEQKQHAAAERPEGADAGWQQICRDYDNHGNGD